MEKELVFSIVIPTFNRAEKLKVCLESLANQTYKNFEVLVCDDGSTDRTKEVVIAFQEQGLDIKYFFNENWGGPAFPRNVGIAHANAAWVCFLDSDDSWYPNKLEQCIKYIDKYDFICHDFDITGRGSIRNKIKTYNFRHNVFEELMTRGCSIVTSSVCVKKSILQEMNGFMEDKRLIAVEDFDLWLKIARAQYKFKVINKSLGAYWTGEGNISGANEKQIERLEAVYEKHITFLNENEPAFKQAIGVKNYLIGWVKHKRAEYNAAVMHYKKAITLGKMTVKIKALYHLGYAIFKIR